MKRRKSSPGVPGTLFVLFVLLSLGALGAAAVGFAATASAPRTPALAAPGRKVRRRPASVQILDIADYMLTVANLDRSVAFYHEVLGLSLLRAPARPVANPLEQSLTDTPGARFRSAVFANPAGGPPLVLEEFTGIARRTLRPRVVDPGAATIQIGVRDLARVLTAAAHARVPFVTRGDGAVPLDESGTRGIVLRDPDGFYVRLSQPPGVAPAAAPRAAVSSITTGNVLGLRVQYTVAAPATIVRFYHGVLGLRVHAGAFTRDGTSATAVDTAAGSALQFAAFRGVPRHTYGGRPQDPGTPAVALQVNDLTAALRAIRASGTLIVSAGGQPLLTGHGGATILARDPAGLLVQLIQEPAAAH
jgi:catechol 2,3-dioxygenase-like lactoylglutathione lyase family enzyme